MDERSDWHTKYRLNGLSKDMINVTAAEAWLEKQGIYYMGDFILALQELEGRRSKAAETLRKNEARRTMISKIEAAADTIIEKKPIVDAYHHIFFQARKEKYAEEHADDLKASKRAYAFLMKNHDGKLDVEYGEFKHELERMEYADEMARDELAAIKDELTMLRKIKGYVLKADPDLAYEINGERPPLEVQLARAQEAARQREAERKTKAKKYEQAR